MELFIYTLVINALLKETRQIGSILDIELEKGIEEWIEEEKRVAKRGGMWVEETTLKLHRREISLLYISTKR